MELRGSFRISSTRSSSRVCLVLAHLKDISLAKGYPFGTCRGADFCHVGSLSPAAPPSARVLIRRPSLGPRALAYTQGVEVATGSGIISSGSFFRCVVFFFPSFVFSLFVSLRLALSLSLVELYFFPYFVFYFFVSLRLALSLVMSYVFFFFFVFSLFVSLPLALSLVISYFPLLLCSLYSFPFFPPSRYL